MESLLVRTAVDEPGFLFLLPKLGSTMCHMRAKRHQRKYILILLLSRTSRLGSTKEELEWHEGVFDVLAYHIKKECCKSICLRLPPRVQCVQVEGQVNLLHCSVQHWSSGKKTRPRRGPK